MIDCATDRFGLRPERLAGDTAYGSADMLNWMVVVRQIAPHIPVIDKSARRNGTFSREDFRYDPDSDGCTRPAGEPLTTSGTLVNDGATLLYRGSTMDCGSRQYKERFCQHTGSQDPAQRARRRP